MLSLCHINLPFKNIYMVKPLRTSISYTFNIERDKLIKTQNWHLMKFVPSINFTLIQFLDVMVVTMNSSYSLQGIDHWYFKCYSYSVNLCGHAWLKSLWV